MPELTMKDVFTECQKVIQCHGALSKNLLKIYNKTDFDVFWESFIKYLKFSLVVYKREPVVERTLDFVSRFATSLGTKPQKPEKKEGEEEEETEEEEEEMEPFLKKFFYFLLSNHNACDRAVRYRCCQMVNKLLYKMSDDAQLDDDLYEKIYECMLQRLRDKVPIVRVNAVFALSRLQDPGNKECPVINAYMFLLGSDPHVDVRRAVLVCIAPSTKTLPALLERSKDVKDIVRKLAFQTIAEKVHIKALTIAQRIQLLQNGLNDRVAAVRESCSRRLVQAWLCTFQGNILELINCLDIETSSETTSLMLKAIFSKVPFHELVENFDLLNKDLVIPVEELSCESVFYWRSLCQHLCGLGTVAEPHLEKVLPSGTVLCNYIKEMFNHMKGTEDIDVKMQNEFIIQELLQLTSYLDLADEVGRGHQCQLIRDLLMDDHISDQLVAPLLTRYNILYPNEETRINNLVEIISDIVEPLTEMETGPSAAEKRKVDLQIASVRVKINQLREELEETVEKQEFEKAAELKASLKELEESRVQMAEQASMTVTEVRTERTDPETQIKCMTIIAEMLKEVTMTHLIPSLQTLVQMRILPAFINEEPAIRNLAVRSLGLCCLVSKDMAREYLLLFVQVSQVDQEAIKVTALHIIFDFLLTYGLDAFQISREEEEEEKDEEEDKENRADTSDVSTADKPEAQGDQQGHTAGSLLRILTSMLDNQTGDVLAVVAEGMAKLMTTGRVSSSRLFSRLVLLWYNPISEDETYLRHCLGTFFPFYAFARKENQEIVEESVLPTIKTLFNAPACSPLAQVMPLNVAQLLIQLCNSRHLCNPADQQNQENNCHDNLAVKVCNEILSDPNSFNVKVLVKMLNLLELSPNRSSVLKDLKVLGEHMLKEVKDRQCSKSLEKFQRTIKDYLHKIKDTDVSHQGDEIIPEEPAVATETAADPAADPAAETTQDMVVDAPEEIETTQLEGADELNVTHRPLGKRHNTTANSTMNSTINTSISSTVGSSSDNNRGSTSDQQEPAEDYSPGVKKPRASSKKKLRPNDKKIVHPEPELKEEITESVSEMENEVFASPTPVRRTTRTRSSQAKAAAPSTSKAAAKASKSAINKTRKKLEDALDSPDTQSDSEVVPPSEEKKPKRQTRTTRRTRNRPALSDIENEVS